MLNMCLNHEKVERASSDGDCGREGCWTEWQNRVDSFSLSFFPSHFILYDNSEFPLIMHAQEEFSQTVCLF